MNIYAESQVKKAISSEISINFFFVYYDPRINNYLFITKGIFKN
jgi:hypothetical protein